MPFESLDGTKKTLTIVFVVKSRHCCSTPTASYRRVVKQIFINDMEATAHATKQQNLTILKTTNRKLKNKRLMEKMYRARFMSSYAHFRFPCGKRSQWGLQKLHTSTIDRLLA